MITCTVLSDLVGPESSIGSRLGVMVGAPVPEASIHEDRHLGAGEDQVCCSSQSRERPYRHSVAKPQSVNRTPEGQLWLGVTTFVRLHAPTHTGARCDGRPRDRHVSTVRPRSEAREVTGYTAH